MEMLYSWEQSDTKTQINPFTTNHYAFILLSFFFLVQEQSRGKVKLSKNAAFDNFACFT